MITKTIIKKQDGATTVEFAIMVPLLLLLTFGIIEFGLLLFNKHIINNSSREGARAGIVAREDRFNAGSLADDIDVAGTVSNWIGNHLVTFGGTGIPQVYIEIVEDVDDDPTTLEQCDSATFYSIYPIDNFPSPGGVPCLDYRCCLKVRVSYEYHFLFLSSPLFQFIGLGPINSVAESVMLME